MSSVDFPLALTALPVPVYRDTLMILSIQHVSHRRLYRQDHRPIADRIDVSRLLSVPCSRSAIIHHTTRMQVSRLLAEDLANVDQDDKLEAMSLTVYVRILHVSTFYPPRKSPLVSKALRQTGWISSTPFTLHGKT